MLNVQKQTASMHTRDGVRLDADIYRPDAAGPFPVLLMRQPYGRAIASTVVYAHPIWYAAHGYLVVVQDVRGRGTSEGEFRLFAHEIADGEDTVNWAASLPDSTGEVGMYGFSYQGMTQLYAAANRPPALKVLCPAMIGYDLYRDWAYEGGAFCLQANLGWAMQLSAETARLTGDPDAYSALATAAKNLPVSEAVPARSGLLESLDPTSFYHAWLDHPEPGDYWEHLSPQTYLTEVDLPMLHVGGWYDTFLRGTLRLYREFAAKSAFPQHLVIGPWAHLPWGRKVGGVDFGPQAVSPCDRLQLAWFDHFLKGKEPDFLNQPSVQLFELGSNQWRSLATLPAPDRTPYRLTSTGRAGIDETSGALYPALPAPQPFPPASDALVHDPWRPVPALGGHASAPSGMFDRASLDCRSDILTYTTAPLPEAIHLLGEAIVYLDGHADTPSFDICAVLSEVHPNGSVYNLSQGYLRVNQPGSLLQITLQAVCARIPAGNCLRLSLSAACFPAYPVNAGTGSQPGETRLIEHQIITLLIHSGGASPSRVELPIVPLPIGPLAQS